MSTEDRRDPLQQYIGEVKSYLPRKAREDIGEELKAHFEERIDELRSDTGTEPEEQDVVTMLSQHGHPLRVASSYQGGKRTLVGPDLYPFYRSAVLAALAISTAILVVLIVVDLSFGLDLGDVSRIWMFVNSYVYIVGIVTMAFVATEYFLSKHSYLESWSPEGMSTPDNPIASAWGAIFSVFAAFTWLIILNMVEMEHNFAVLMGVAGNPFHTLVFWMQLQLLLLIPQYITLIFNQSWSYFRLGLRTVTELLLLSGCIVTLTMDDSAFRTRNPDLPERLFGVFDMVLIAMIVAVGISIAWQWRKAWPTLRELHGGSESAAEADRDSGEGDGEDRSDEYPDREFGADDNEAATTDAETDGIDKKSGEKNSLWGSVSKLFNSGKDRTQQGSDGTDSVAGETGTAGTANDAQERPDSVSGALDDDAASRLVEAREGLEEETDGGSDGVAHETESAASDPADADSVGGDEAVSVESMAAGFGEGDAESSLAEDGEDLGGGEVQGIAQASQESEEGETVSEQSGDKAAAMPAEETADGAKGELRAAEFAEQAREEAAEQSKEEAGEESGEGAREEGLSGEAEGGEVGRVENSEGGGEGAAGDTTGGATGEEAVPDSSGDTELEDPEDAPTEGDQNSIQGNQTESDPAEADTAARAGETDTTESEVSSSAGDSPAGESKGDGQDSQSLSSAAHGEENLQTNGKKGRGRSSKKRRKKKK